jgi:hypothetical protein
MSSGFAAPVRAIPSCAEASILEYNVIGCGLGVVSCGLYVRVRDYLIGLYSLFVFDEFHLQWKSFFV